MVVAVLLACAACSSTSGERASDAAADRRASAETPAPGDAPGTIDVPGSPGPVAAGSAGARTTSAGADAGSARRGAGASGTVRRDRSPVKVGVHYSEDLGAILLAAGAADSTDGEAEVTIRRIEKWINANGGLGGRKLEVVLHGTDPLNGSFAAQAQATCSHFTEDEKVSFVVSGAAGTLPDLVECLSERGIPMIWGLHVPIDGAMFRKYRGFLYQPFNVSTDRQGFFVDELAKAAFFRGAKVGIIRVDNALHDAYNAKVFRPRLRAHKVPVASEFVFSEPQSAGDAGALYAQASNAALRFRQAGVTHVLFAPTGGTIPFVFQPQAESQGYRPRYAFNSLDIPAFVDLNAPDGQLDGALAVGWMPTSDVLPPQRPKDNTAERLCLKITESRSDIPSRYCDGLFFLKALFEKGADGTAGALQRLLPSLRRSYVSPWTFKTDFTSGRPDGAASIQMLRYADGCGCFEYQGPRKVIG